jgi:DNA-directed RNA polymerase I subunit RPA1
MNIHFPQNQIARAESMLICRNEEQYLVPTDGSVLRGLIQDHVDAGVMMTSRDSFFTREEYIQLLYIGLRPEGFAAVGGIKGSNGNIEPQLVIGDNTAILMLPPAIMRPTALWTGKQIISTLLLNLTHNSGSKTGLNMISKSKIPAKSWGKQAPEEQKVIVMDGYLLTGILDKSQFGASSNGLVHAVHQVYGPAYAGKLLTIFGRLFSSYLQFVGFSCRMDDLTLTPAGDKVRRGLIDAASNIGIEAATAFVDTMVVGVDDLKAGLECVLRDGEMMGGLDSAMKAKTSPVTSGIISKCIPDYLSKPFPQNNMQVCLFMV